MGHGKWDDDAYAAAKTFRAAKGIADFGYTSAMKAAPADQWKADPSLDPLGVAARECRDSADHADSTPIAVLFDVTGSMGRVPQIMQRKLGRLHGLLQRKGYLADPQLMFGGIGDADSDRVPLQVGQFESDNRMDEQLRTIFLEGGGGGQKSESYELAAYFVARHVVTDAWRKRGRKGYLFLIGDEMNKPRLAARHIRRVIGDDVRQDISPASVYRELARKWHVYFVLPKQSSYYDDPEVAEHWRELLGQHFLKLEDPGAVCELIAATIGLEERAVDLDQAMVDLAEVGSAAESRAVGRALVQVGARARAVPAATAPPRLDGPDDVALN
ncbi:hypothetical protein [Saccharothrix coeruleofusca]|uniref:VWA domain-containing protein n=1 Tax=Saccharothrix coeruleofusca TaxID=33919 RepID=A0A918EG21_9PSEU|nr:hypothetical protein [Saccharothrix coeruleofusca]MBP2335432.1 hypothetical protein [Saccharothrix coeruleofusca]GGP77743.1 hypothetical protein GCM10010185_59470 [Saccharothrix coeruleofusca]